MSRETNGSQVVENIVTIAAGAGNEPITVEWQPDDTVETVLGRAEVKIGVGETVTIGRRRIKNPAKTKVNAGDLIVIATKPANG